MYFLATSQVSTESYEAPVATNEELLIQAMDTHNNDATSLLQQDNKVDDVDKSSTDKKTSSTTVSSETEQAESDLSDSEHKICIKLKFINDDQKLVTGSLREMLGDFKK